MTMTSTVSRVSYAGNGVTTAFSFPYKFLTDADLIVIERIDATGVETTKTLTTHYTVSGAGVASGGTVTMLVAPATGKTLTIYRDPALKQELDLVENDDMPAEELEKRLDLLTMICQRLSDRMDRAICLTDGVTGFSVRLPSLLEALKVLRVNAGGTALELVAESAFVFDSASPATTKGDLVVRTASANVRLPVGSLKGQIITPDSAQAEGLKWAGPMNVTGTRAAPTAVTAVGGIAAPAYLRELAFVQGSGGAVDLSANPQVAAGSTVGQELILVGRDDTNTILLEDGTGLSLNGPCILNADNAIGLFWDGTNWSEMWRRQ